MRKAMLAAAATAFVLASSGTAAAAGAATQGGSLDTPFGSGGSATVSVGVAAGAAAVAVQPNGAIVTAGQATIAGQGEILSTRMLPDGSLDPTYGSGGIVTIAVNGGAVIDSGDALALEPDGDIGIAGAVRASSTGQLQFAAIRLTSSGALDQSFGNDGIATVTIGRSAIATGIVVQQDGKIVIAGCASMGHNAFAAARLNPNGSLDSGFGNNGIVTLAPTGGAWGIVLQSDGKLVLAGQANYANPSNPQAQQFMAARLNPNGTPDASFGAGGIVAVPIGVTALGFGVALQNDGRLVLAGSAFTTRGVAATVRLNPDGSLDPSYGSGGIATFPDWYGVNGITLDGQGRIVLPTTGPGAVRLNGNGSPDATFGSGGNALALLGSRGGANGAAVQADGEILLAGAAAINGQTVLTVQRLNGSATPTVTTPPGS